MRREVKANELSDVDVRFVSLVKRGANRIPFRLTKEDTNRMLDFVKLFRKSDEEAKPAPSSAPQHQNSSKEPPKEEKDPVLAALARLEEGQRALAESIGQLVAKVQKTKRDLHMVRECSLTVALEIKLVVQSSAQPSSEMNAYFGAVQRRLAEDPTLGGLVIDLVETSNDSDVEDENQRHVAGVLLYTMKYRHSTKDPRRIV